MYDPIQIISALAIIALVGWLISYISERASKPTRSTAPLQPLADDKCIGPARKFVKNKRKECSAAPIMHCVIAREDVNHQALLCPVHFAEAAALDSGLAIRDGWNKSWLFPKIGPVTLQFPHKEIK